MGVKRNTLRWSSHRERIKSEEIVKEAYVSKLEGSNLRGMTLGRWKDKVMDYMCERDKVRGSGFRWIMRACLVRAVVAVVVMAALFILLKKDTRMDETVKRSIKKKQKKARRGKVRQGEARQGKARQGKARQGKSRQGKSRQIKER